MSRLRSLRGDLTLKPFELRQTHSDSAAMASGPPDVMANQEPAEVAEECSGKKKSKFQTFKKFFARKKRKEPSSSGADAELKASQSSDNVSKTSENNTLTRSEKDKGSGSKISLGSKALSHDSVFVSDSSEANEALGASQDSIHGKVKSLQLQLKQAIRLGSPPSLMCVKRTDDAGTMSEDDGLPCSPPEYTSPHTALNQAERNSSISLEGTDSDEEQLSSSWAVSPLVVVPGDFSQPASPFGCLDNSAAKHKLGLRHKACNKRKAACRQEMKAEGDSVVKDIFSIPFPECVEAPEGQKTRDVSEEELEPKVEGEEVDEDEELKEQSQHFSQSLLGEMKESEKGDEESDTGQEVSNDLDTSCPPEACLSAEEASSEPSSRASSLGSPRVTPEPPTGQTEYLLDRMATACGKEEDKDDDRDLTLEKGGEDGVQVTAEQEEEEEESSFLMEVLSSLKTPLASCSLGVETEGVILEMEEVGEVKEDEAEIEEPVDHQEAPSGSLPMCQTPEEEEWAPDQGTSTPSSLAVDEEENNKDEDQEKEEEEGFSRPCQDDEEEEAEAVQIEEEHKEEGEEEDGSEEEDELVELQIEPEEEEEGQERTEEEEGGVKGGKERVEEAPEEAEMFPGEDAEAAPGDDAVCAPRHSNDAHAPSDLEDQECSTGQDGQVSLNSDEEQNGGGGGEGVEEGEGVNCMEQKSDEEEHVESHEGLEQKSVELLDLKHPDTNNRNVDLTSLVQPPALSLAESFSETSGPSKTSSSTATTTIHINLVSPSSEKATSPFLFPETAEVSSPHAAAPMEPTMPTPDEESADRKEEVTEEEQEQQLSDTDAEEAAAPPASEEEPANQSSSGSDQKRVRFTIVPAWQRSLSPPSSPPPCSSSLPPTLTVPGGVTAAKKDPHEKTESAGGPAAEPQSAASLDPVKPAAPAAAAREESSVMVEGNTDNPFGVRLRKTAALHRVSSEEDHTEAVAEPPAQPTSCRVESPQPISGKPSTGQPISNKPALPKKPDIPGDSGMKMKRISDAAAVRFSGSDGSHSPSWISVAKQKQKLYKENSLEEIAVRKEEPERKSSLPMYVSSAACGSKMSESTGRVAPLESRKPSAAAEKECRRACSPPTPVPPQPPKSHLLPSPVPPKPASKHPPHPSPSHRPLSPPTPVPIPPKPSNTKPPPVSPAAASPEAISSILPAPNFSTKTAPPQPASRAPALSGQTPLSQRGLPPPALPQDEPPWMALAKKKAKAWSEMPQIVQ
ncbi:uncharacterized protein ACBR49_007189 [Aulostomus maculatus]